MSDSFPAVVSAAGRSHRMGSPKALLSPGGKSFLARILDSLKEGGAGPVIVVTRSLDDAVAEEARRLESEVVLNPDPSTGPISSLQAGIRRISPDVPALLLAPVDHPLFSPATVRALITGFKETGAPMVVPAHDGKRGHPVLFGRSLFPELLEEDLPEGARTVVRRYLSQRLQLPVDDPGILANIDTPEEYRKYFPSLEPAPTPRTSTNDEDS